MNPPPSTLDLAHWNRLSHPSLVISPLPRVILNQLLIQDCIPPFLWVNLLSRLATKV